MRIVWKLSAGSVFVYLYEEVDLLSAQTMLPNLTRPDSAARPVINPNTVTIINIGNPHTSVDICLMKIYSYEVMKEIGPARVR